ncbi:hypothetical protein KSP39_PZI007841 [Platanthera zijinensis]|uniref:Uncharacterized protein n=1 Tax=Platanthera zijinensis TaxID=2320716 RepID=A0AAP0G8U5_9ASPA
MAKLRRIKPKRESSLSIWCSKLFRRFREALLSSLPILQQPTPHQIESDLPKSSCSSYISPPNSHYDEAIADCIEFLNKSCGGAG